MRLGRDKIEITLYASLLIVILELLFFRISPQFYSILNTLPLLLATIVISFKQSIYSITLSFCFFFLINSSDFFIKNSFISSKLIISQILVSFLVLIFLGFIKFCQEKKKMSTGETLSYYMLPLSCLLVVFLFFFFSEFNFTKNTAEIAEIFSYTIKDSSFYEKIDINYLIRNILKLLPSINLIFIQIAIISNYFFAKYLISKLKLHSSYFLSFYKFKIPNWYFWVFIFFFLISSIFQNDLKYYFLNLTLFFSFIYFLDGIVFLISSQKKIKINSNLKILIIFLLFIFLGYLLILLVFFVGFIRNAKYVFDGFSSGER